MGRKKLFNDEIKYNQNFLYSNKEKIELDNLKILFKKNNQTFSFGEAIRFWTTNDFCKKLFCEFKRINMEKNDEDIRKSFGTKK